MFEFLRGGAPALLASRRDPAEVPPAAGEATAGEALQPRLVALGRALADGTAGLVGVWGPDHALAEDAARHIAAAADRPLRRLPVGPPLLPAADPAAVVQSALATAAAYGAIVLVRTDDLLGATHPALPGAVADALAHSGVPAVLCGDTPWLPAPLLAARPYADVTLPPRPRTAPRRLGRRAG